MSNSTGILAKDVQVGDQIIVSTGSGPVKLTVSHVYTNPHKGWIGFSFDEWKDSGSFNWRGWYNPTDVIYSSFQYSRI